MKDLRSANVNTLLAAASGVGIFAIGACNFSRMTSTNCRSSTNCSTTLCTIDQVLFCTLQNDNREISSRSHLHMMDNSFAASAFNHSRTQFPGNQTFAAFKTLKMTILQTGIYLFVDCSSQSVGYQCACVVQLRISRWYQKNSFVLNIHLLEEQNGGAWNTASPLVI